MKIIKVGNKPPPNWWDGMHVKCWNCKQVVELEDSDEPSEWEGFMGRKMYRVVCCNCKEYTRIKR